MSERVAIIGASGLLGSHLDVVHGQDHRLSTGHSRRSGSLMPLDLADQQALARLVRDFRPSLVYLPAAVTSPAWCQDHPPQARAVNTEPAKVLADLALEMGFRLIFVSSDLVFDGRKGNYGENDPTAPLSVYGRTKVQAEEAVLARAAQGADCLVVRTSLIIGADRFGLAGNLAWMDGVVNQGGTLSLFEDEFRNPVAASELARGLSLLAKKSGPGLYHLAGPEKMSRLDLGRIICKAMGWPLESLKPARLADLDLDPPRPADVSLNQDKAEAILGRQGIRPLAETLLESLKPFPG